MPYIFGPIPDTPSGFDAGDVLLLLVTVIAVAAFIGSMIFGCHQCGRAMARRLRGRSMHDPQRPQGPMGPSDPRRAASRRSPLSVVSKEKGAPRRGGSRWMPLSSP